MTSSPSTSSPAESPGARTSLLESLGKLKLVLRLELELADLPDGLPLLEKDVLRDDCPDVSAPVGEGGSSGDCGGDSYRCPSSRLGISENDNDNKCQEK